MTNTRDGRPFPGLFSERRINNPITSWMVNFLRNLKGYSQIPQSMTSATRNKAWLRLTESSSVDRVILAPRLPQNMCLQARTKSSRNGNPWKRTREGARNFARCLLGILPSVLSLHDPAAVDEALQQFASDVCEAVTCMALKRKNVPNFGTLRGSSDLLDDTSGKGAKSYLHYPILNADCVYAAVYATLKLNLKLHRSGYYSKRPEDNDLFTQV